MRPKANLSSKAGLSALAVGTVMAATSHEAVAQDWTKHFRIGMQFTVNIDAEFDTGGAFTLPQREVGQFDDGYVLPDRTTDPKGGNPFTTNWGYDRENQFDPKSRLLTFSRTEGFAPDATAAREIDDSPYLGLEAAFGTEITRWNGAVIGWEIGYGWLPMNIADRQSIRGSGERFLSRHFVPEDVLLPAPGHRGSDSGEQQPVIEFEAEEEFFTFPPGTLTGSRTLELSLHTFRLGPTLHYEFDRRWAVQASAGGAVALVAGDYVFRETARFDDGTTISNEGKIDANDFVYGGYINGVVLFHVEEHGDIYAGVQFMTLSDTEVNESGRSARLNLGGAFSFLIGVNWPF